MPVSPFSPNATPVAYFGSVRIEATCSPTFSGDIGAPKPARNASRLTPSRRAQASAPARERLIRHVAANHVDTEPLRHLRKAPLVARDDGDARLLQDQRFDDAQPEPAAAAGHDHFLPFQSLHGDWLLSSVTIGPPET